MQAEVISIGSELTSGRNLETNARWISQRLAEVGVPVLFHTTVADDIDANVQCFRLALERTDLVITTGGLGPTQDDLTREVVARVAGVELVEDAPSFEKIQAMFARRGRVMPDRNRVQALFPAGSEPIPNDNGTAPGVWMKVGDSHIACLPGVPTEMYAMFREWVLPKLAAGRAGSGGVLIERKINAFGAGESDIESRLMDLTARGRNPEVGISASDATISLRILARADSSAEAEAAVAPIDADIRGRLGHLVFGTGDQALEDVVVPMLDEKRLTLATAEGVTAGLIAHRVGSVPGASRWFRGGVIAYDNGWKEEHLGVPEGVLHNGGAVSAAAAEAMAAGCRARFGTDLAVSSVGVAGPQPLGDLPVGLVFVALAHAGGCKSFTFNWSGTREQVMSRTAKLALNAVRLHLQG